MGLGKSALLWEWGHTSISLLSNSVIQAESALYEVYTAEWFCMNYLKSRIEVMDAATDDLEFTFESQYWSVLWRIYSNNQFVNTNIFGTQTY